MTHNQLFFISSLDDLDALKTFFDGYAFVGADMIIGQGGMKKFRDEHKSSFFYEDGNYVAIQRVGGEVVVSRDYHGYYPLFYYKGPRYWCVSNSILYIVV